MDAMAILQRPQDLTLQVCLKCSSFSMTAAGGLKSLHIPCCADGQEVSSTSAMQRGEPDLESQSCTGPDWGVTTQDY